MGLKNLERDWRVLLAALYLPGAPHGIHLDRRRWPAVLGSLRAFGADIGSCVAALGQKGHFAEAAAIQVPASLAWSESQIEAGRVLTCLDKGYPDLWLAYLGDGAPPALWRMGEIAETRCFGIVGSRNVEASIHHFCAEAAREAVGMGYCVVSGGAMGCDSAAVRAAAECGSTLVILPYGISHWDQVPASNQMILSLCEPDEPFSTRRAMERNALIYATATHCLVAHCRFRAGGSWHGAVEALRRRRTRLLIRRPGQDEVEYGRAALCLLGLGAKAIQYAEDLSAALDAESPELHLFSALKAG